MLSERNHYRKIDLSQQMFQRLMLANHYNSKVRNLHRNLLRSHPENLTALRRSFLSTIEYQKVRSPHHHRIKRISSSIKQNQDRERRFVFILIKHTITSERENIMKKKTYALFANSSEAMA